MKSSFEGLLTYEPSTHLFPMNSIGERIRQHRQKLGYTQERLAAEAGISKGFISDVETGNRQPSAEYLLRIANALKVSTDYLMKGGAEPGADTTTQRIQFPQSLTKFALENKLPFDDVKAILEAKLQIVANRRNATDDDLERFDWAGFYEAIKDYM
jgi:transcriptional regulator with XRE-family HTH domain